MRLAAPFTVLERLKRLAKIEDQFRMAVGHNPLGRGVIGVLFKQPKGVDEWPETRAGPDFTIPNHHRL